MDGKGRATDNICIERFSRKVCFATAIRYFWRSAKCERIYLNEYFSIKELIDDTRDYIEFYNYKRFHQSLQYKKPMDVYFDSLKSHLQIQTNDYKQFQSSSFHFKNNHLQGVNSDF